MGSRPRQGVARLRANRETPESLHMLSRVQRMWRNEPSHSQVNSHVGSWSPKRIPESSERNCRGQNALSRGVLYVIGKLLKRKCVKWARIAHLDIWNTSYGQKKNRESNWQFDSRPLKVGNRSDFLACRQCATYDWKTLDEKYNFALDFIAIKGLHKKLSTSKVAKIPIVGLGFRSLGHLGIPRQQAIWMWPPWRSAEYTIRGKVVDSPQV